MALVKYEPFHEMDIFDRNMSRFFDSLFDVAKTRDFPMSMTMPKTDIVDDKDHYTVHMDLPGMKKEDLKVELKDSVLTISGERKDEKKTEKKNYISREIRHGSFLRRFNLPEGVTQDKIDAKLENGTLEVVIPKPPEIQKKESAKVIRIK